VGALNPLACFTIVNGDALGAIGTSKVDCHPQRFNHTAPCVVKRAEIADGIGPDRHSPHGSSGLWKNLKKKTAGLRAQRLEGVRREARNFNPKHVSDLGGELSVSERDPVSPKCSNRVVTQKRTRFLATALSTLLHGFDAVLSATLLTRC
jgi:hypothetical protein